MPVPCRTRLPVPLAAWCSPAGDSRCPGLGRGEVTGLPRARLRAPGRESLFGTSLNRRHPRRLLCTETGELNQDVVARDALSPCVSLGDFGQVSWEAKGRSRSLLPGGSRLGYSRPTLHDLRIAHQTDALFGPNAGNLSREARGRVANLQGTARIHRVLSHPSRNARS